MLTSRCHLCNHSNSTGARFCGACGVGLVLQCSACGRVHAGLVPVCEACGAVEIEFAEPAESTLLQPPPPRPASARRLPPAGYEPSEWGGLPVLSLDDAVPVGAARRGADRGVDIDMRADRTAAPAPAAISMAEAFGSARLSTLDVDFGPPSVHLRDMDHPEVWVLPDGEQVPPPAPPRNGREPELVRSDMFFEPSPNAVVDLPLDLPPATTPASKARPVTSTDSVTNRMPMAPPIEAPAAASPDFVDHRDAKAARRAAVRRARLAAQAEGAPVEPMPTDILVVDRDDATRQRLCLLLDSFGFNVQSSRSPAHAVSLLASRVYLAVFADVDLQDARPDGGVEVCRLAKEGGPLPDGRRPALIMMSAHPSSAERVRAALAGSEQYLVKPLARGHVARALEACDIPLPSDPRRASEATAGPNDPFAPR